MHVASHAASHAAQVAYGNSSGVADDDQSKADKSGRSVATRSVMHPMPVCARRLYLLRMMDAGLVSLVKLTEHPVADVNATLGHFCRGRPAEE